MGIGAPFPASSLRPFARDAPWSGAEAEHLVHLQGLGQLVGDEEHGDRPFQAVDRAGELVCRIAVKAAGRFVEDEDLGLFQQRPGDGQALALAARKADAVLAQWGLVSLGQGLDDLVNLRQAACVHHLLETNQRRGHDQVLVYRARKDHCILRDYSEVEAQLVGSHVPDVPSIQQDAAVRRLVEALQEFQKSAFAAA